MPLNRPFDSARQTNDTGGFVWVNNPQVRAGMKRWGCNGKPCGETARLQRFRRMRLPGRLALQHLQVPAVSAVPHGLTSGVPPPPPPSWQSLLINSRGCYLDCALGPGGSKDPVNCSIPAANYWIGPGRSAQQPWASAVNPGASAWLCD